MTGGKISRRAALGAMAGAVATSSAAAPAPARDGKRAIVVGAGAFGAWSAWRLLREGWDVLLLDAWGAGHARSSSGGETRLIRTEYDGDPLYTGMAWSSLADWKELAARHADPLFHAVGALYLYPEELAAIDASLALNQAMGIAALRLEPAELARRWPQMRFDGVAFGVLQPTMGALMARRSLQMLVHDFVASGGRYQVAAVEPPYGSGDRLGAIQTSGGDRLVADRFVFACGPWLPRLFPAVVGPRIQPTRQEVFFFAPEAGDTRFAPPALPAWVDTTSADLHYGFPDIEARGFKIALDAAGPPIDPDTGDRRISAEGLAGVRAYLARRFPALASRPLAESRVCQYENSASRELLIDRHPAWTDCWIAGAGSGHGFKHGPAVGRMVAELVGERRAPEPRFAFAAHPRPAT